MNKRLLCLLLIGTGIFDICDYFLTVYVIGEGHGELNPVVALTLDTPLFPVVKLALIPAALLLLWLFKSRVGKRLLVYSWIMFICYSFLMVYFVTFFL